MLLGIGLLLIGIAIGVWLAKRRIRYGRIQGFRYLVILSQLYGHFTISDVTIAFDPTCADERRQLLEHWRRTRDEAEPEQVDTDHRA